MMFPSVFGENLFDDWMDDFGFRDNFFSGKNPLYGKHAKNIMKTDVRETDLFNRMRIANIRLAVHIIPLISKKWNNIMQNI